METEQEQRIRQRAYDIWLREGRPHGRDGLHWQRAEAELAAESAAAPPAEVKLSSAAALLRSRPVEAPPAKKKQAAPRQAAAPKRPRGTKPAKS